MSEHKSIIDGAWDDVIGGMEWLKSVLLGEFVDNRSLSAVVADMLISFVPGVVIVTSARDAVAVIVRLAQHPEKQDDTMEWVVLAACMITLALPLALAAGGAAAAGVGAVVGGIAGSELGAALRSVMLLLIKEGTKLGDVIRFLQKFIKGDLVGFLRAINFVKYEKALLMAFDKTAKKLIEICQGLRCYLERFEYFNGVQRSIAKLKDWERKFYAVQVAALKQLPIALTELNARLAKVVAQIAPKESHTVLAAVRSEPPSKAGLVKQHINDTAGKPLLSENVNSGRRGGEARGKTSDVSKSNGGHGGGDPEKPPRKDQPEQVKKPDEGANSKRQEVLDGHSVIAHDGPPAGSSAEVSSAGAKDKKIGGVTEAEKNAGSTECAPPWTKKSVFNTYPEKVTLQTSSRAEQSRFLSTHIPELSEHQADAILEKAFGRNSSAVFGGSRVRGDYTSGGFGVGSDIDVGFGNLNANQAGKVIDGLNKQFAQDPSMLMLERTRITPGNSTPTITDPIVSPEEFFQRSGMRIAPDSKAGQPYIPSGSITVRPNGEIEIIPPGQL